MRLSNELERKQSVSFYIWVFTFVLLFSILFFYIGAGTVFGASSENKNQLSFHNNSSNSTVLATSLQIRLSEIHPAVYLFHNKSQVLIVNSCLQMKDKR